MADHSAREPLVSDDGIAPLGDGSPTGMVAPAALALAGWALRSLMWAVFVAWVGLVFFFPTELVKGLFSDWTRLTSGSVFAITGSVFLAFSAPILVIALLGFIYIAAFPRDNFEKKKRFPRLRLWTFPVLTDGPFGVVSAAEFIGILLFSAYILWSIVTYSIQSNNMITGSPLSLKLKSCFLLEIMGLRLGSIGLFCMVFLFLPVSRGSVLLRLIDIPFEHATRYHVWLGHLTMVLFTLHGLFYAIAWSLEGNLLNKMLEWKDIGVANLPGVISLAAGLLMWVTSLHYVRKNYFELFFYTHQLYVIFAVFLAMHVGDFIFSMAAGAIFLFILDRFLRFCQSRTSVDVISASCRPCGTVELILSKPANLRYNALSFIFLQVRELSWLQWHPFSVSSSPLDGRNHMSVLIKVLGEWTEKLRDIVLGDLNQKPHQITACVEGPYGHESPYHLMYENLILVAGGIGISPFLAILSDVLHRVNERKPCLPKNILVIWAVKKTKELSLLSAVNVKSISSSAFDKLHLDIQAYVTQESEAPLGQSTLSMLVKSTCHIHIEEGKFDESASSFSFPTNDRKTMSCLVGTGNNFWSGTYFLLSTLGFIAFYGLLEIYYMKPFKVTAWWYRGLLFTICMVIGVVVVGGVVIFLWHKWEDRCSGYDTPIEDEKKSSIQYNGLMLHDDDATSEKKLAHFQTIQYGSRPDFEAIFDSYQEGMGHVDVGVFVCGPPGLQSSVAKECRAQSMKGRWSRPVFHFNSHSFDL
ncbi:ferric reduction oxidase 7, chloroplastic-like isoform X1 [Iris pallida]|uniref:Ferric reduction oxidase 7, chloroplastic-like isoform X1 n=1 Tax=Iris pallida TaxID=29817 RepID=A0AAX6EJD2_IRIPA|nr:ferric reduction oxidase 7, chloroplastic-like isoform X1 [Iris pallida]